ncbi:XF1762 family protein [Sphingomonas sp. CFBP 13706]|uniref:XF1762 family protein n=1 Tax=Sphingomonas sp. CFBP 13706 TaxID=2775314 RepID=UPI0018D74D6C|nr:XF1762 family protein [Sphingomonas sp. CFBP 13706]
MLHGLAGEGDALVGIAVIGRPVARALQDGLTMEVTCLCTDGEANGCSMLYGAARRAAVAKGYRRGLTYILASETGASRRAAGLAFPLARPRPQLGHAIAPADRQAPDRGQARLRLGRLACRRMIIDTLNPRYRSARA